MGPCTESSHSSLLVIDKILLLLGDHRRKRFLCETLGTNLSGVEKWKKIISLLNNEMRLCEAETLFDKSTQNFGLRPAVPNDRLRGPNFSEGNPRRNNSPRDSTFDNDARFSDRSSRKYDSSRNPNLDRGHKSAFNASNVPRGNNVCFLCNGRDHVTTNCQNGTSVVHYVSCKRFAESTPGERSGLLREKDFCQQCLVPGLRFGHVGPCSRDFNCKHDSHGKFKVGRHFLVCWRHNDLNSDLLSRYKKEVLPKLGNNLEKFTLNIEINFPNKSKQRTGDLSKNYPGVQLVTNGNLRSSVNCPIFMLQTIVVDDIELNVFFDSGCSDLVCRKSAIDALARVDRASNIVSGPITISGVGDNRTVSEHGIFKVTLPLGHDREAVLCGTCLDTVTAPFPDCYVRSFEAEVREICRMEKGDEFVKSLPRFPRRVGGATDIMIGIKYLRYFPQSVYRLPSGLTIFESVFQGVDGTRCVIGGPHEFQRSEGCFDFSPKGMCSYFYQKVPHHPRAIHGVDRLPLLGVKDTFVEPIPVIEDDLVDVFDEPFPEPDNSRDVVFVEPVDFSADMIVEPMDSVTDNVVEPVDDSADRSDVPETFGGSVYVTRKQPRNVKQFELIEDAGTAITYRCMDCRNCSECKQSGRLESISIQEEIEQSVIERTVEVDNLRGVTSAKLPFMCDPVVSLKGESEWIAKRIYLSQIRKLVKTPVDMNSVVESENK